ncbi:MAG: hypothetical protein AAEJ04_01945 [Planctomycetota bacterium]
MRKWNFPALQVFGLFVALLIAPGLQAQLLDFDDFESYAVGSTIAGQGSWQTWDFDPNVDSDVVDTFALSGLPIGSNALELSPADDIVRTFGGLTGGAFSFTSQTYIPSGQAGNYYFILLNTYDGSGSGYNWSGQITMNDATGEVSADNVSGGIGTFAATPIVYDTWVEVQVDVDLDAVAIDPTTGAPTAGIGVYQAFYNGAPIVTDGEWTLTGQQAMQCLDLYNGGNGIFYYDTVQIECIGSCGCLPFDEFNVSIDCVTNDVTMDWTSFLNVPGGYAGGITLSRNGAVVATLAGDDTSYVDVGAPLGLLEYTLTGDCGAGETTSATAVVACTGACPPVGGAGDECCDPIAAVSGANPFDLTLYTDSPDPADGLQCAGTFLGGFWSDGWYTYTAGTDSFLRASTCGTIDTDLSIYEEGASCGTKTQIACSGDICGVSSEITIPCTAGTTYIIRVGSWDDPDPTTAILTGDLVVQELCDFGLTNVIGVVNCSNGDVDLSWNPSSFTSFDILRDNVTIASGLPFGTTSYQDLAVDPGAHVYGIVGNCSQQGTSVNTEVNVNVQGAGGFSDLIVAGEGVGGIDSVLALQTALTNAGIFVDILPGGPGDIPCLTDASLERIWYMGGTFPANRALTDADGTALATAQQAGKHIYVESGDAWGFDAITAFNDIDGVADTIADGDDSFLIMDGLDTTYGLDLSDLIDIAYTQDQAAAVDWTDQLITSATDALGPNSTLTWQEDITGYGTGIFYDTDNGGKVLVQSWEFGGFGGDQADLLARYIGAMGGAPPAGPTFGRGDCNADGGFNIADAIYTLASLFSGGPAGTCSDACDSNDDGSLNIADAIFTLAALFSGGPAPADPAPATCGEDPTTDSIDCASFAPCP